MVTTRSGGADERGFGFELVDADPGRPGDTADSVEYDVINFGRAGVSRRRWPTVGKGLFLAASIIAAISARHLSGSHPHSAPAWPSAAAMLPIPPPPAAVGHPGPQVSVGPGSPVGLVLNSEDNTLYVLLDQPAGLSAIGRTTRQSVPALPGPRFAVLDEPNHRLWVISDGTAGGVRVRGYDADTLSVTADRLVPFDVTTGAVLDGALYLGGRAGLVELRTTTVALLAAPSGLGGGVGALVADPSQHRLLVASTGDPASLWIMRTGAAQVLGGPTVPLSNLSIADVLSQIWVSGTTERHNHLQRLDPGTLQPAPPTPAQMSATAGAVLGSGDFVIWEHDASNGTLTCLDAVTGEVDALFANIDGPVVSTSRSPTALAYAINAGHVITLDVPPACQG